MSWTRKLNLPGVDCVASGMRLIPIVVFAVVLSIAQLRAAEPVLRQTFAKDTEGWTVIGNASGSLNVSNGQLAFHYTATVQGMSVAVLPVGQISLKDMKSVRFELRTDSPFAIGVVMSEKKPGGGNYTASVWSNGGEWQPVVLSPRDFVDGEGPAEPSDADGRLDLDQVEGFGLIDISQIFSRMSNPDSPVYAKAHTGEHTFSIRNFELSSDDVVSPTGMVVDDFGRPQSSWLSLGDAKLSQTGGTLRAEYQQQAEQAVAFLHSIPAPRDFRGATHLAFDIGSSLPGQFVLSLQEARHHSQAEGPRYNVDFFVPAGTKMEHREIALSALNLDENGGADKNGKLDLNDLRSLSFLDVSHESGNNVLTIANLRFVHR